MRRRYSPIIFLFTFLIFSSCVAKKKHLEAISILSTQHQTELQTATNSWTTQLHAANEQISQLQLNLAERKGENNALVAMQDKLEGRIEMLKKDLASQGRQSQSTRQDLSVELGNKETEIKRLEGLLQQVNAGLDQHLKELGTIANDLRTALQPFPSEEYSIQTSNVRLLVVLTEKMIFKPRSTTQLNTQSTEVLSRISEVLQQHPSMVISVLGHTDNQPPKGKSYQSNWMVSAIRSAIITDALVKDYDLSANQVTAAGKGEFAPRASNETFEGRSQNKRIELHIEPRQEDWVKKVRQITDQL